MVKKAILLYMYLNKNTIFKGSVSNYYDKIPLKYENYNEKNLEKKKYD